MKTEQTQVADFAYLAAHDLKSPIQSIKSLVEIMRHKFSDEELAGYIEKIQKISDASLKLIEDLLSLSKLQSAEDEQESVVLECLLRDTELLLEEKIKKSNTTIEIEHSVKDKWIYCQPGLIREVFQNLISNSIKFNKNAPYIRIGVLQTLYEADKWIIFIEDNGIGISDQKKDSIFDAFVRGKNGYEGSGLGLSIVKKVIEVHESNIWFESKEGYGTTFFFALRKGRVPLNESKESWNREERRILRARTGMFDSEQQQTEEDQETYQETSERSTSNSEVV